MDKDTIVAKLRELKENWDDDSCIDWAFWALEEIDLILNSKEDK